MKKNKFYDLLFEIEINEYLNSYTELIDLIMDLFSEQDYANINMIYFSSLKKKYDLNIFEIAYSLKMDNHNNDAIHVYKAILDDNKNNPSILNNLAIIYKELEKYQDAYSCISEAKEISSKTDPNYNVISSNFEDIRTIYIRDQKFKDASKNIIQENDFILKKLATFLENIKNDKDYNNGIIPIPRYKFPIFLELNEQMAMNIISQWLIKMYIYDSGMKNEYHVKKYIINPYIGKVIFELEKNKKENEINNNWIVSINNINNEYLAQLNYFINRSKLKKTSNKFKKILLRDYDELILNYVFQNHKSVVILTGSLIEGILTYNCYKNKNHIIIYVL